MNHERFITHRDTSPPERSKPMNAINPSLRFGVTALLSCGCLIPANGVFASEPLLVCSADSNHTAFVGAPGRISYRKTSGIHLEHTFYVCHPQALAFSEDGQFLAAAGGRNGVTAKLKVWRMDDYQQLCEISISGDGTSLIAVAADGRLVVMVDRDGRVAAWRVADGKPHWTVAFPSAAKAVRFSADGRSLLLQSAEGKEYSLDPATGRRSTRRAASEKAKVPGPAATESKTKFCDLRRWTLL